jgi:hypothetical protein
VSLGTDAVESFCEAVTLAPDDIYWAGRLTLVSRAADLPLYDRVFAAHYGGFEARVAERPKDPAAEAETADVGQPDAAADAEPEGQVSLASLVEVLREKSFSAYSEDDLRVLLDACRRFAVPSRPSRRSRPARDGELDLRRTLRAAQRRGGEPIELPQRAPGRRPRPVVMLLDVSGSMTSYSRALLHFAYASVRAHRRWEVFCFATRLTRLTRLFDTRTPDEALAAATAEVGDWDGGTRIGASIERFLRDYGHRGMARGAVVLICSDGLEIEDPANLGRQMHRLGLLAHHVIWLNPLKEDPAYEPLARGMRAALPHVDVLASAHNLASLEWLAGRVDELVSRG